MIFSWLEDRRRRKILEQPFPSEWTAIIEKRVAHWVYLDDHERAQLQQLVQVFVEEKDWEGLGGLEMTDEIRVTIATEACLLILGLEHSLYRQIASILVYPRTVLAPPRPPSFFGIVTTPVEGPLPVLGQAMQRGPIVLVWDAVRRDSADGRDGHNVVLHEFAHKLDMLDGSADGVPPLADDATYRRWIEVFTSEYEDLKRRTEQGQRTYLGEYALTNGAEFFAVATEHFFEQPLLMERDHGAMYQVLRDFYRQDTAARERRWKSRRRPRR
ncbi:MAG TPA: M90 family metallopeptidase [Nannocystaceae bacterium]|nr:M90 family metallopeptidase [Nannocystaceae bacterium]